MYPKILSWVLRPLYQGFGTQAAKEIDDCLGLYSFYFFCAVLHVALLSGKRCALEADPNELVGCLKQRALAALGLHRGSLLLGEVFLDDASSRSSRGMGDGDTLILQAQKAS